MHHHNRHTEPNRTLSHALTDIISLSASSHTARLFSPLSLSSLTHCLLPPRGPLEEGRRGRGRRRGCVSLYCSISNIHIDHFSFLSLSLSLCFCAVLSSAPAADLLQDRCRTRAASKVHRVSVDRLMRDNVQRTSCILPDQQSSLLPVARRLSRERGGRSAGRLAALEMASSSQSHQAQV
ncbi:hypothetical protein PYCCODRAFT_707896 [Trametes coccinea BRFM310]|uniref:Uncharacterized protein n=1 Tax=Trametes coccinea (strain BRFM310) TaxID=1353009 RepID=A0A1Y2IGE1_TRAC3|nr:hypothetical protein PYCCODRAFT_707896 [Trametes coccinea BRFM310]